MTTFHSTASRLLFRGYVSARARVFVCAWMSVSMKIQFRAAFGHMPTAKHSYSKLMAATHSRLIPSPFWVLTERVVFLFYRSLTRTFRVCSYFMRSIPVCCTQCEICRRPFRAHRNTRQFAPTQFNPENSEKVAHRRHAGALHAAKCRRSNSIDTDGAHIRRRLKRLHGSHKHIYSQRTRTQPSPARNVPPATHATHFMDR